MYKIVIVNWKQEIIRDHPNEPEYLTLEEAKEALQTILRVRKELGLLVGTFLRVVNTETGELVD